MQHVATGSKRLTIISDEEWEPPRTISFCEEQFGFYEFTRLLTIAGGVFHCPRVLSIVNVQNNSQSKSVLVERISGRGAFSFRLSIRLTKEKYTLLC